MCIFSGPSYHFLVKLAYHLLAKGRYMDNSDNIKSGSDNDAEEPIPFDDGLDEPIPFDDSADDAAGLEGHEKSSSGISHSPLHLGSTGEAKVPRPGVSARLAVPAAKRTAHIASSGDRITAVKTFFTKLHAGAISFLDEQICDWLEQNPDVVVKRTNTVTGMVQGKKTEPNIIVTIWY